MLIKIIKTLNLLFMVTLSLVLNSCSSSKTIEPDTSPIKEVNIEKYLGKWYEIARFPNKFEKNLVGVTANYSMREDGKIKVVNAGHKNKLNGPLKQAIGKAKIPNIQNPGHLKVSFFLWFYADYNILYLDPDYSYVLVGSSGPDYLWILSRSPKLDPRIVDHLKQIAKDKGYDVSKLELIPQLPLKD